jgi:prephenate dehydrogenase
MAIQITLVGLGQIGTSMGLALGGHANSILRVGHDRRIETEREAQKLGAIDKGMHNLPAAVREARLVVLSLPLSQIRRALEVIGQDLPEGAVVLDTSPIKTQVLAWAKELLPAGRHYIGLVPGLNPEVLEKLTLGEQTRSADLFKRAVFIVDAPIGAPEEAVNLACNFVELLGASPLLADLAESDGLMASAHLMPQLAAAAILNATVDRPGWEDVRKLASRAFAAMTSGLEQHDELESLRLAALHSASDTVRALDVLIAALQGLRDEIEGADEAGLARRLEAAKEARERWRNERMAADWTQGTAPPIETPSVAERLFGSAIVKPRRRA